jgi:Alkylmercury lyase
MFYPGTKNIRWFWPFSSIDHGVEVGLNGYKPVHARCAIDALGMSAMFGRMAKLTIKSPLDHRSIEMEIDGNRVIKGDSDIVVSHSDSCDDMLFFSSKDEYSRYVKQTGKTYLKLYTIQQALERGVQGFGEVLKA